MSQKILATVRKKDVVHPELSYVIMGILFDVNGELGGGLQEKYYQRAVAESLKRAEIDYHEQVHVPIEFHQANIGRYFLDFLIEDKLVLEIKRSAHFSRTNIRQIYAYLKATGLKLGILANFTNTGVQYKRIVNIDES